MIQRCSAFIILGNAEQRNFLICAQGPANLIFNESCTWSICQSKENYFNLQFDCYRYKLAVGFEKQCILLAKRNKIRLLATLIGSLTISQDFYIQATSSCLTKSG